MRASGKICGLLGELCLCEEFVEEPQMIRVIGDSRRTGKLVTVVDGLDSTDVDISELARTLRNKCAAGGTAREGRIELRGDHRKKVAEVLESIGYEVEVR
jgi:translation initiation factor 1